MQVNTQLSIFDYVPPKFSGATYEEKHDRHRLESQYMRVFKLMSDGKWRTLREICDVVGGSEAGISARLRDYRKVGRTVERRRVDDPECGLWEYRLV